MQLESMLRSHPPVERYAGAAAVVTGQQKVGADHDVLLSERARVSSALTARLAAVPGVRAAIGDVSVPARLGGRSRRGPRVGQRGADALRADRRTPARRARRGRHRLSRRARRAAAPRVDRTAPHRHGRRRRSSPPPRLAADGDLPDRRGGSAAGRPSRPGRRDRRARRPRLRHLAPARRRSRRGGARPATRAAGPSIPSFSRRAPR